ncbi:HNH endonuclease [Dyadobacter sp. CY323]|uniref:HNH endonuclease n=1 Tax=Dyadobacter sp. CY323 TaxID=2907302 RepID=UPI001F20B774|nr:HNH endonuclease signature motif containing protein [Dyadobacter sp. CY323]MCE6987471.1 HNH endonuclease [Dyadobacter sp. CY323]
MGKKKPRKKKKLAVDRKKRTAIPLSVARQVRQECYFGCVLCGSPVFHYDHIEEYSVVKEHKADNLALLCASHHNDKTTKKIDAATIKEARLNPFNKNKALTAGHPIFESRNIDVTLGNIKILANLTEDREFYVMCVNGIAYISITLENGWLSLSMAVTNDDGKILLAVDRGNIQVALNIFDYTYVGDRLIISEIDGAPIVDLNFSNTMLKLNKGQFIHDGSGFVIDNEILHYVAFGNVVAQVEGSTFGSTIGAISICEKAKYPEGVPPSGFAHSVTV